MKTDHGVLTLCEFEKEVSFFKLILDRQLTPIMLKNLTTEWETI